MSILSSFKEMFSNVSDAFGGRYGDDDQESKDLTNDALYGKVPGFKEDKENIKGDFKNISNDIGKALQKYKELQIVE